MSHGAFRDPQFMVCGFITQSTRGWWALGRQRKEIDPDDLLNQTLNRLARFVLQKCCILGSSLINHLPYKSKELIRDLKVKFVFTCFVWLGSARSAPGRIGLSFSSGFFLYLRTFDSESSVTGFLQASLQREVDGTTSTCIFFPTNLFTMVHVIRHFITFLLFLDYCLSSKFRPKKKKQHLIFLKTKRKSFYPTI